MDNKLCKQNVLLCVAAFQHLSSDCRFKCVCGVLFFFVFFQCGQKVLILKSCCQFTAVILD